MLREIFIELANKYSGDEKRIADTWKEIEKNYSSKNRHYHTLAHLENVYLELSAVKNEIADWDTLLFSLFYHDVIYKPTASDNEEKSAALARERLAALHLPQEKMERCASQIIATKLHGSNEDHDTNLFTDADLSILGENWETYVQYFKQVRKEYAIYPDFLYKPGRKKVLLHFLNMPRIFKTDHFYRLMEQQARRNLKKELKFLNS